VGPDDRRERGCSVTAQIDSWRERALAALRRPQQPREDRPRGNGSSTPGKRDACCVVLRTHLTPTESALEVLPLYEPMAYKQAHHRVMTELLTTAHSNCLSDDLDGGVASLLVFRNLATRTLEKAIQRGEVQLVE
jgi:hypothetical protein